MNDPMEVRNKLSRRAFLKSSTWGVAAAAFSASCGSRSSRDHSEPVVRTVLGPVTPDELGVTLTHEHAPTVDWSELYEAPVAPITARRAAMLARTAQLLDAFHSTLGQDEGPGAIVEATPIRVGRYPRLLVELAQQTKVHIIASTGFWCEAFAPQHPWAVRLSVAKNGARKMANLFVREITSGMEDPAGAWGERFTDLRAGIIKVGTSTFLRPSERVINVAAAIANKETGCPITTHTTNGGGLEQARLLLGTGASPGSVVIGHQGYQDDRKNDEAHEYHVKLADLGVYVQFDRVGADDYSVESQARQVKQLIDRGYVKQVLLSHDRVPYMYTDYAAAEKSEAGWDERQEDFTVITTQLVRALGELGVSSAAIRTVLVENPARMLAF